MQVLMVLVIACLLAGVVVAARRRRSASRPAVVLDHRRAVGHELERARRYGHPVAVVHVSPPGDEYASTGELLRTVQSGLRAIDLAWSDDDGVHALLAESGHGEAEGFVRRLQGSAPQLARADIDVVVFPRDGVTTDALLAVPTKDRSLAEGRTEIPVLPADARPAIQP